MSEASTAQPRGEPEEPAFSLRQALRRLARGELGSIRVLLGIAVIWTIFQLANDRFLSAVNLSNLTLQIAAVATISIGVVLVLLLGRDRPLGRRRQRPRRLGDGGAQRQARLGAGARDRRRARWSATAIGLFNGFMVTIFGIPSFVVTLAGLLGWQGVQLLWCSVTPARSTCRRA